MSASVLAILIEQCSKWTEIREFLIDYRPKLRPFFPLLTDKIPTSGTIRTQNVLTVQWTDFEDAFIQWTKEASQLTHEKVQPCSKEKIRQWTYGKKPVRSFINVILAWRMENPFIGTAGRKFFGTEF